MVEEDKAKFIFRLASEFHNDVTEIYETVCDDETHEMAVKQIDALIFKLRILKTNLIPKEIDEKEEI